MLTGDTIAALSTPPGESAIALIRLSGSDCPILAQSCFTRETTPPPRRACYGSYRDHSGTPIDDCVYTTYTEGASYTGEAMLEIACHGNPLIAQKILEDLLARGCRIAEPGEFTRLAYLNGKLDLTQAEAVADLIRARSDAALQAAHKQLKGQLGDKVRELTDRLLQTQAEIEAYIDFPEEDLPDEDSGGPLGQLRAMRHEIGELLETSHYSRVLHEGIKVAIVGAPNAGKSSLLNALLGSDRALVSSEAGTTRDFITEPVMLGKHRIQMVDTAGLHETSNEIERQGIEKTLSIIDEADILLLIVDTTAPPPPLPEAVSARFAQTPTLVLENKTDLPDSSQMSQFVPNVQHLRLSLKANDGLPAVREALSTVADKLIGSDKDYGLYISARHADAFRKMDHALKTATEQLQDGDKTELAAEELRIALEALGEIVGKIDNEAMLDRLFSTFCIGK